MNILALDIATKTGWAQQTNSLSIPTFGVAEFPKSLAAFADAFENWLKGRIEKDRPEIVAVEAPVPVRGTTRLDIQMRCYGAHAITRMTCLRSGLEWIEVNVGTWRKWFIGSARAPKEENGVVLSTHHKRRWLKQSAIAECERRGWPVESDDAADALGVLAYVREHEAGRSA